MAAKLNLVKNYFCFCLFILISISTFSQVQIEKSTEKIIIDGKKYYVHTVEKGQTLYSISKVYGVSKEEILSLNPDISENNIKTGSSLKIPVLENTINDNLNNKNDDEQFIYYVIQKGDTEYKLCRKFGITKDEFYAINDNLSKNSPLKTGTKIKFPIETTKEDNKIQNNSEINTNNDTSKLIAKCDSLNWYSAKKEFEISILLPFDEHSNIEDILSEEIDNDDIDIFSAISETMMSFYFGCLTALENFQDLDISLKINTFSIGRDNEKLKKIIKDNKLNNSNLIIGPAFRSQIDFLNEHNSVSNATFLLPFSNEDALLKKYPNNIMFNSSNSIQEQKICDYISKQYINANVLIIENPNNNKSLKTSTNFQKQCNKLNINHKTIKYDGEKLVSLSSILSQEKENILISTYEDEIDITKMLTSLLQLKKQNITFIGNSKILDYKDIDPKYFSNVKFTHYTNFNIDYKNSETYDFLLKYRTNFNSEPNHYSFEGYDITNYFVDKLLKHGDNFYDCLEQQFNVNGVSGLLQFEQEKGYKNNSFINSSIYIHSLQKDYSFKLVYP